MTTRPGSATFLSLLALFVVMNAHAQEATPLAPAPTSSPGSSGSLPISGPSGTVPTSAVFAPDLEAPSPQGVDDTFLYRLINRLIPETNREPSPPPDINFPGPDTANFPNSPFTLPKGRAYIETSPFLFSQAGNGQPQSWGWSFMLRFGLTDNVEFRLFSNGPSVIWPSEGDPGFQGFAPLVFDLKIHLWGEKEWEWTPIVGLEVFLSTDMASRQFRSGIQPGIALLVDHNLPWDLLFEWNVGLFGQNLPATLDKSELYVGAQWALQKQVTEKFAVFFQGFYNTADMPFFPSDLTVGVGAQLSLSDRMSVFGSWNWTLDNIGNPTVSQAGFAYAF